jgi:hypothetical protein
MANEINSLREHLVSLLRGGNAHVDLAGAVEDFPPAFYGTVPENAVHSAWQILEHMRIALHDLLDFSTNPQYRELIWPDQYWPASPNPPSNKAWQSSVEAIEEDLKSFEDLIAEPKSNLFAEIPWGNDHQTLLREVLVAADHQSYHTGELVLLRRLLGAWKQ